MDKVIEFSVMFVLGEIASYAQSRFNLPDFVDQALDNLFQLNASERSVSQLRSELEEIKKDVGKVILAKRKERITEWLGGVYASKSDLVHDNEDIVKHVAVLLYSLEESGVQELVVHDSKNITAIISQAAFESEPEETLTSIVTIATSDSHIERFVAYGFNVPNEVVSEKDALWRSNFIIDLINILSLQWDGRLSTDLYPAARKKQLKQLKNESCTSWMLPRTKQKIVNSLEGVTFRQLAKSINGSHPQDSNILNVFIVGSDGTGKSTTRFLLSGRGRDGVSQLKRPTRNISVEEVHFEDHRIMFWDTPGLQFGLSGLNRASTRGLRDKMMAVNGISAVILQTNYDGYNSDQEMTIISMLNKWFRRPLNQNLMISFKAGPESRNRAMHVQNWERALHVRNVGTIGASNYIHFDAPDISYDNCEEICRLNSSVVEAIKRLITNKDIAVDKSNWRASEDILECQDARDSELRSELRLLYDEESSDHIKSLLKGARKVRAAMENEDLVFKIRSGCILFSPFHFAKRLCAKSSGQDFALRTTGSLSINMVEKIVPDPRKTRRARRKPCNILSRQVASLVQRSRERCELIKKASQKLDELRPRDYIENWIATVCSDSFELYLHGNEKYVKRPIYLIFERDCYVTEQAVDIVLKRLGVTVTLELLDLSLESNDSEDGSSSSQRRTVSDEDLVEQQNCFAFCNRGNRCDSQSGV